MKDSQNSDINELLITGLIVSQVRFYDNRKKCVFTLENCQGRFFVQWTDPTWHPEHGQRVMVHGAIFSVLHGKQHSTRVQANKITVLQ